MKEPYDKIIPRLKTFPASSKEASELSLAIQEKMRGEWNGVGGFKDGVNLGLAVRIIDEYAEIMRPR